MFRQLVNSAVGSAQSRYALRKEYQKRTLVLSNNWDGSVQQFYHFILGYFVPLCTWIIKSEPSHIAVRDCGPMNCWFDTLKVHADLEIIQPGSALHVLVGNRMRHQVLQGLDDPSKFELKTLRRGIGSVLQLLDFDSPPSHSSCHVLVVDRATSEDFYHGTSSETHMSGKERRHVPNLASIAMDMQSHSTVSLVDFARMAPREQIQTARNCDVLVGQHGAGLSHMLWMKPGSHVVEIAPPLPIQVQEIFSRLANILGHSYSRVTQDSVHASVDPEQVIRAVGFAVN